MTTPEYIVMNGEAVPFEDAKVHIMAPAVTYAATAFEGIRGYWSEDESELFVFRLRDHLRRLQLSMKVLRFDEIFSIETLQENVMLAIRANQLKQDIHLRLLAYIDGIASITTTGPCGIAVTAGPYPANRFVDKGATARSSSWARLADNASPPRVKYTGNYGNSRFAMLEAKADDYDIAIMLTGNGKVSEAPVANLFMLRDGEVSTPRRTDAILESITRHTLIDLLDEQFDKRVNERGIDRSELYMADEIFVCGSGWEITPVTSVDKLPVGDGTVGPLTRALYDSYIETCRGRNDRHRDWLTPVWGNV